MAGILKCSALTSPHSYDTYKLFIPRLDTNHDKYNFPSLTHNLKCYWGYCSPDLASDTRFFTGKIGHRINLVN